MALSGKLRAYLALEHEMIELDRIGDAAAEALRDAMDGLWYALREEERDWLDRRIIGPSPIESYSAAIDWIELPSTPGVPQPGVAA